MSKYKKLELTWVGKDDRPRLEPRILVPNSSFSYGTRNDNGLIFGDNLLALKALEFRYSGAIQCVYIDPPYNTGSAFAQYDDGVEHSLWLSLLRERIDVLRNLLSPSGVIWVHLDDNEAHYCKVMMDEVFGRQNFVANVIWNKSYAVRSNAAFFSTAHEHLLVYAKDLSRLRLGKFRRTQEQEDRYSNPDKDPRGPWQSVTMTISLMGGARGRQYAKTGKSENIYEVVSPSGKKHLPPANRCWSRSPSSFSALDKDRRIYWGPTGENAPRMKMFLSEADEGVLPTTLWQDGEVFGLNQQGVRELRELGIGDFPTPKPERLIGKIIEISTQPGEFVLDSFAGSGTTGAVAHKMGRRWIMIELGEHCHTHIIPRLKKVIDGQDPGGVTETVGWKGGGGFRYYRLASSLLKQDEFGNWIINDDYNPEMLAEAVCKLEGFTYEPSATIYWQHGKSTERDYIYVTTQTLTHAQLHALSDAVGKERTLLVMCSAYRGNADIFNNLTIKKIPKTVQDKCEWDKDDYSLALTNAPVTDDDVEDTEQEALLDNKSTTTDKSPSLTTQSKKERVQPAAAKSRSKKPKTHDNDQQTLL